MNIYDYRTVCNFVKRVSRDSGLGLCHKSPGIDKPECIKLRYVLDAKDQISLEKQYALKLIEMYCPTKLHDALFQLDSQVWQKVAEDLAVKHGYANVEEMCLKNEMAMFSDEQEARKAQD